LRLANEIASASAVAVPATAVVTQLINALIAAGGGDLDYSAMGTVLFELAKLDSATVHHEDAKNTVAVKSDAR
jgi:DNA integrity scanning protein DisA with diadenylate cyclase activity